jgi:hypothetical protein
MARLLHDVAVIPLIEPADHQGGIEAESFRVDGAAEFAVALIFGALTGDAVLSVYTGATAAAKTTKYPFRYRLSGADYKAEAADQYGTETADADGDLTLTAATYDHRTLVIYLDPAEFTDTHKWVTLDVSDAGTVVLLAGVALARGVRYAPAATQIALG